MYNTDLPRRAELPSTGRLFRSLIFSIVVALALLVTVVLPSEYGIDPTTVGRMLGLTQMGEIKKELSIEAALDEARAKSLSLGDAAAQADRFARIERRLDEIAKLLEQHPEPQAARPSETARSAPAEQTRPAPAQQAAIPAPPAPAPETPAAQPEWRDEITIVLSPGQGVEFKLVMNAGAIAEFEWTANGSVLNYDTHGNGSGQSVSYEKGRAVPEQAGELEAAFKGNHGWFWRNRTNKDVTLTLRTRGDYSTLKRTA